MRTQRIKRQPDSYEQAGLPEAIISGILLIAGLCAVVAAISLLTADYWF
jgi:hypothetical protein